MPTFESLPDFEHGRPESLGVLIVNLGTPSSPSAADVRRYLREFLWDPRVVEVPRPLWWLILHGFILRFRPSRSARAYRKVWTADGSPLLLHSRAVADNVRDSLGERVAGPVNVELAMTYGAPSIRSALAKLINSGSQRIVSTIITMQRATSPPRCKTFVITGRRTVAATTCCSRFTGCRGRTCCAAIRTTASATRRHA